MTTADEARTLLLEAISDKIKKHIKENMGRSLCITDLSKEMREILEELGYTIEPNHYISYSGEKLPQGYWICW